MQLGLCPEAASHLQEFKDNLIAVSNELIDNVENLSSVQIAKLREDRCAFTFELFPITFSFFIYTALKIAKGSIIVTFLTFFTRLHYYAW
jgi:hypothetical protein